MFLYNDIKVVVGKQQAAGILRACDYKHKHRERAA
jgi:hypothetical protein